MVISFIGFFAALILLIIFTMRGVNIIIAALVSSAILALTSRLPLEKALTVNYMDGFTGYFASWFLVYLLGAVFAVVTACALMTYGGVSIAIVAFSVYPIAVSLFKAKKSASSIYSRCYCIWIYLILNDFTRITRSSEFDTYGIL